MRSRIFWGALSIACACGHDMSGTASDASKAEMSSDAGDENSALDAGSSVAHDAAATVSDAGTDPWTALAALIDATAAQHKVPGLALAVYDEHDRLAYAHVYGDFALDRRVAVASASKLISGMVLLDVVSKGELSLDDTTGDVLGWTGPLASITLRHLLSFTSGLAPKAACTSKLDITLAECVDEIAKTTPVAAPGERFDYGSTHLHVAARMAEVRTKLTWDQLFRKRLADPLKLPAPVSYYTAPRSSLGTQNPLIAGGLRTSVNEYAQLLAVAFHRGHTTNLTIASPELFDEATREPFPDVTIGDSPAKEVGEPFRYGLSCWLECAEPAQGCSTVSSPGAFGFTPWLDRAHGYYAVLGMELSRADGGVVDFSVQLEQSLEPMIVEALSQH